MYIYSLYMCFGYKYIILMYTNELTHTGRHVLAYIYIHIHIPPIHMHIIILEEQYLVNSLKSESARTTAAHVWFSCLSIP